MQQVTSLAAALLLFHNVSPCKRDKIHEIHGISSLPGWHLMAISVASMSRCHTAKRVCGHGPMTSSSRNTNIDLNRSPTFLEKTWDVRLMATSRRSSGMRNEKHPCYTWLWRHFLAARKLLWCLVIMILIFSSPAYRRLYTI